MKRTDQPNIGSEQPGLAPTVVLPGMDTQPRIESPPLVAEWYKLNLERRRVERKLAEIEPILKARTGERQVGDYLVNVSSFSVERVDTDATKKLLADLGVQVPMVKSPAVRLTVVLA